MEIKELHAKLISIERKISRDSSDIHLDKLAIKKYLQEETALTF